MALGSMITSVIKWLWSIWGLVPDSEKEKVAELVADVLTKLFRAFYAAYKNQAGQDKNDTGKAQTAAT